ncbi:uncharacterized protein [Paramisgurnus dabryanus]|uniref:uncharacterized protein n=1 Tax=Paramisgurnus dabryanus TaxID=90735 RepID=UPI0031F3FA5C
MMDTVDFHTQLTSIMEVLAKTAVVEIGKLFEETYSLLGLEIKRCTNENDSLRKKCLFLETELQAARGNASRMNETEASFSVSDGPTEITSIQRGREFPTLEKCTSCCSLYHCPFCSTVFYKPSKKSKLQSHLQLHFSRAVIHDDYTIHRCGLSCKTKLHYHCVYCSSIVYRRDNFEAHLKGCKIRNASFTTTTSTIIPDVPPLTSTTSTTATSTTVFDVPPLTATTSTATTSTANTSSNIFDMPPLSPSMPCVRTQLRKKAVVKTKCPYCQITIHRKNLRKHLERKHTKCREDITASHHLYSDCIDQANGGMSPSINDSMND